MRQSSTEQMTNPPKHKTDSHKGKAVNSNHKTLTRLKISFSQIRMWKETSEMSSSWFRCPRLGRSTHKFCISALTTLAEVPGPGALSKAMLHSDLIRDTCLISPTLVMVFPDWPGMRKGMWRESWFESSLDSNSLVPCPKAGQCSAKLSLSLSLSVLYHCSKWAQGPLTPPTPCEFPMCL